MTMVRPSDISGSVSGGVTGGGSSVVSRPPLRYAPALLLVGASTGGPQALTSLTAKLAPIASRLPICVTLHMPPDLTPIIAAHVARICGIPTRVVSSAEEMRAGIIYFAPGDASMSVQRIGVQSTHLVCQPLSAREACRSAIDIMFASAAKTFGARALAVVLSGMGQDGLEGARAIAAAGGTVLAQDKASSAVWGMPRVVAQAGLASATMSPIELGEHVMRMFRIPVVAER
jgi:two-component system, chemotaxis family, protein-glutamate methylesterase/glutaminase